MHSHCHVHNKALGAPDAATVKTCIFADTTAYYSGKASETWPPVSSPEERECWNFESTQEAQFMIDTAPL